MLLQMALFHSFLWLNNIPLRVYTPHHLQASMLVNSAAMNIGVYVSF